MSNSDSSAKTKTVVHGVLAEFESPGALIEGAEKVRDAGYTSWDCHSPFPVHGLDPAMGIKPTILPVLVFGGGATGLGLAILMQTWMNGWDYPWLVSGKPLFSLPMQIPIAFEVTVLLAAFTCFFGMWTLNKLPQVWHPLFSRDRFMRATTDSFFVAIDAGDPKFDSTTTVELLESAGATSVETVSYETGPMSRQIPRGIMAFILLSAVVALVPFALVAKARASTSEKPHFHIIPNMDFQPKYKAQNASDVFPDGRASRLPVEGTVARGELKADDHFYRGMVTGPDREKEWATEFPAVIQEMNEAELGDLADRGAQRFGIYCSPCHGLTGEGTGMVNQRAETIGATATGWVSPSNITQETYVRQPHGQIFNTITHGIRTMPGYAAQIPERDRWAIVLYVRALQRSANASVDDVPEGARPAIR